VNPAEKQETGKRPSLGSGCPPVLLIVFNRLESALKVLDALRSTQPARIFVAGDGPRADRAGEVERVAEVRARVLREIDWPCEVLTLFQERNLGCCHGPASAISWFFQNVESGIVLEDDCVPDATFFPYCAELLERYATDERVMMVSGNNFLFEKGGLITDSYYFSKYHMIWGWATWRRAWEKFDPEMSEWPNFRKSGRLSHLHPRLDERRFWTRMFDQAHAERVRHIWDFQWLFAMWNHDGTCICPAANLVSNVGYGVDATHTLHKSRNMDMELARMEFPLRHPAKVRRRLLADNITCDNYFLQARRFRYWASLPNLWLQLLRDEIQHFFSARSRK